MKRKLISWITVIIVFSISLIGFRYIYKGLTGDPEQKIKIAQELKEKMEKKYDIVIINCEGYYSHTVGYGATFTTENGISFDAWSRPNLPIGSIDFYMEENKKSIGSTFAKYHDNHSRYPH